MNVKAVAVCALMLAASPAAAQYWGPYGPGGYGPTVPLSEIEATLRANGLRPIMRPVWSGRYVVVRAVDSTGEAVRVLMNARFGNIVQIIPLPPAPVMGDRYYRPYEPYRPFEPYPRYGAVRPDLKTEPAPSALPPGDPYAPPNAQVAHPGAAAAPYPPMPRPRPAIPAATAAAKPAPDAAVAPSAARAAKAAPETTGSIPSKPGSSSFPPAAPLE